jgi:hypothetical protein
VILSPLEVDRRLSAAVPWLAEQLHLSPDERRRVETELRDRLLPLPDRDERSYETLLTSVQRHWNVWRAHRHHRRADFYLAAFAAEVWALAGATSGQPQWRRLLTTILDTAVRGAMRRNASLTEAQVEALGHALTHLAADAPTEADVNEATDLLEASGLEIAPGFDKESLPEFVALCADDE